MKEYTLKFNGEELVYLMAILEGFRNMIQKIEKKGDSELAKRSGELQKIEEKLVALKLKILEEFTKGDKQNDKL